MSPPLLGYPVGMLRRRLPALVAALVTLVGTRVTMAAPAESTAVVRAMSCCTGHCGAPESPQGAARCCRVERGATDPFKLSVPEGTRPAGDGLIVLHVDPIATPGFTRPELVPACGPVHTVGRLYLRALSLRL